MKKRVLSINERKVRLINIIELMRKEGFKDSIIEDLERQLKEVIKEIEEIRIKKTNNQSYKGGLKD